ncbi:NAD(P)H dehydrogenase [Streptomyces triticagri]|uniref:NAD(P)H dehydrogenase n=1 Tax=Streptomyces triticagri TaxID=2293568 RepID=A0A372M751_9ACTN|nr:NAD(P)H-dependent oxidoreductase [Streptomyces triticagri]RFU86774.1 NAD(P)H dehydrogenase [Streptomyces triticagri]
MNTAVNVAVVHYSRTGHVAEIAREIAETAEKAGADVRLRPVEPAPDGGPAAAPDDLLWADAVIMGSPTRFGNIAGELKLFLDSLGDAWRKGLLADKVYSAFTSTSSAHGGQETTLHALMTSFHHFGGILVPPGYTHPDKFADGNPYGTAHCTAGATRPVDDTTRNAARVQAERVVRFARAVKAVRTDHRTGKEE